VPFTPAYDGANPSVPLPRNTARLLGAMFPSEDVCQRSQEAIAAEGFSRDRLPAMLRHLVEAVFLFAAPGGPGTRHLSSAPAAGAAMIRREKVILQVEDVPDHAIKPIGQIMSAGFRLYGYAVMHTIARLGHTALQHIANVQFSANLLRSNRAGLVGLSWSCGR
jgi:hypothetical protein